MSQASSPADTYTSATDPINHFARNIIEDYQFSHFLPKPNKGANASVQPPNGPPRSDRVGIIGGGIGGLYAAYLLQSMNIPYTIYEASGRIGGRLYTYKMSPKQWDYIEMGAMRFPGTPSMKQLFELFDELKVDLYKYKYGDRDANSTVLYNGVLRRRDNLQRPSTGQRPPLPGIPEEHLMLGVPGSMRSVTEPFKDALERDVKQAIAKSGGKEGYSWVIKYEMCSTRGYMRGILDADLHKQRFTGLGYPEMVVDWCETEGHGIDRSSFDSALTETVLDDLAFEYKDNPEREVKWYSIKGGSSELATRMLLQLKQNHALHELIPGTRVTALQAHHDSSGQYMTVHTEDGCATRFGHVINTATLPCLRAIDLSRAELDVYQSLAVRSASNTPATRIGVHFRTAWWQDDELMKTFGAFGRIVGGQSFTDRPIRQVVYPSHGVDDAVPSTVLMTCYAVDASSQPWVRLAGLEPKAAAAVVKPIIINDLVDIHGFNDAGRKFLEEQWVSMAVHNWSVDPHTLGSWAFFKPGQFRSLYCALTRPAAGGVLHFAGDAVSVRHRWMIGALEASKRAVCEILISSYHDKLPEFEKRWGMPEAWTPELIGLQIEISEYHWNEEFSGTQK